MPLVAWGLIGLIIGSKFFGILSKGMYNLVETGYWNLHDSVFNSGIVYWGGLLGFLLAIWLSCRLFKKNFEDIANSLAVVIPLFHTFGRIGCFFAGCCYGKINEGPFSLPYRIGVEGIWEKRLPAQLIEASFELFVFIVLLRVYLKRDREKGVYLIYLYLALYSVFRLFIEFFRDDSIRGVVGILSFSQIISLISIMSISILIFRKRGQT